MLESTGVMADVVSTTLYGAQTGAAKSSETAAAASSAKEKDKGSFSGMAWLIVLVIAGVIVFALMQTGSLKGAGGKIAGNLCEMTGGMLGKKREKKP